MTRRGIQKFILRSEWRGHYFIRKKLRFGPQVSNEDFGFVAQVVRQAHGKISAEKVQEHLAYRGKVVSVPTIHRVMKFIGFSATNHKYCGVSIV